MDNCHVKSRHYSIYMNRVNSFELWPKQMKQDIYSLARAGFFYTKEGDTVECFTCGVRVRDWNVNDIPTIEHEKHSTSCKYMKYIKTTMLLLLRKKLSLVKKTTIQRKTNELMNRL